jgi:hypothetical protein
VYGALPSRAEKATAIAIDPDQPYGPDGELNYVYADFLKSGLL